MENAVVSEALLGIGSEDEVLYKMTRTEDKN